MAFLVIPSPTYVLTPPQPAHSKGVSTSSSACATWDAIPSPHIRNFPSNCGLLYVSASNIIVVIRANCMQLGVSRIGFDPEDIRTQSLCSVRAMAIHIVDVPYQTLMAIGILRSLGFMVYIQQHISSFSTRVYVKMIQQPWFCHI